MLGIVGTLGVEGMIRRGGVIRSLISASFSTCRLSERDRENEKTMNEADEFYSHDACSFSATVVVFKTNSISTTTIGSNSSRLQSQVCQSSSPTSAR